jgi:hypothetical protein
MSEKNFPTYTNATAVPYQGSVLGRHTQRKRRLGPTGYLAALGALFLCVAQTSSARGDSASCVGKVSSYVAELDALLSRERNRLTPYDDLNERYFPFRDCEADALLDVVRSSSFIRSISYHSGKYFIRFSNEEVLVGLTYHVAEKKSDPTTHTTLWIHK